MTTEPFDLDRKLAEYRAAGVTHVKLGLTDIDGVIRGKYLRLDKFARVMADSGGFCDCIFGWDVADALYPGGEVTGWHTGFPDTGYRLISASERWLDDEQCPYFIGEFVQQDRAHPLCPRGLVHNVLGRLADAGLFGRAGFEYEFFVFRETPQSLRDKGYRDLVPLTPGNFGYSVLRTFGERANFQGLLALCESLEVPLEGLHCETGPGVWEGALTASDALQASDRAGLFKMFAKAFFQQRECVATFMAKWSMAYPGQSGHYHFSLLNADGDNWFADAASPGEMTPAQRHAVGGLCRWLPEFLAMIAPTVNSYARLVQGAWAPTAATWGIENRTAAIRVIPGSAQSQRIEVRVPGADANPYLVTAAVLGAAAEGIRQRVEPPEQTIGNAYEREHELPPALRFPVDLAAAADRLDGSVTARALFGDVFVDHFVMSRRVEHDAQRRHVTDWQLDRYFEII